MPVYSHSRISTFEKCPLQYRYRYLDRIPRETQGIEAFLGQRVHAALEHLYREAQRGRPPAVAEILAFYRQDWEREFSDRVTIVRAGETPEMYRGRGESCVRSYHARHAPFDQAETLGLEERVQIALDPDGRVQVQGYIDRLARAADGTFEIHDYKTSASLPSEIELRRDRQLTLYQMAVQRRYPEAQRVRLIWHYLIHGRTLESRRTPDEIDRTRRQTIRAIGAIEAARDFPPHESALCRWCEYRDICPLFAGAGAGTRPAPAAIADAQVRPGGALSPAAAGPREPGTPPVSGPVRGPQMHLPLKI